MNGFNDTGLRGMIANLALPVGLTLALNGFVFAVGWAGEPARNQRLPMLPPDWAIGTIWVVLLALMGLARWVYLRRSGDSGARSWAPMALAAFCLAFPFYTGGLLMGPAAFWGTVATVALTLATIFLLNARDRRSPWLFVPTACWGGYVTCVMLRFM
ncbi:MAG: tryptophan-rich sensory protein [Pseudomonadota bacterium]|uniref:tryptophan-rich sensory protein n=1 Tax=Sphingobium sp. TaxID=1912891 RepID=UPI002E209A19